ncbi:MAG: phosphonopyruvate decarboxylase [Ktedonobacteraceae bacterium]|nr:phosphonopyruvate decarboxylase [Ktedonobacteraceae bacterium]
MLACCDFYNALTTHNITFFTGVPDSLLQDVCAYITDHTDSDHHIIAANEGNAIALAAGYYLSTKQPGLVYMQNSGLGNAVNPLVSLVDPEVYSIPLLMLIGWRGEPGTRDEPQHVKQGKVTLQLLETLGVPYRVLPEEPVQALLTVQEAVRGMQQLQSPYALIVRAGTFQPYKLQKQIVTSYEMRREDAVQIFADWTRPTDVVVSTTGKTSRELFELRERPAKIGQDFLTVGSMGHASQIALGIALARSDKEVFCLDGDGALIMHMGALAIIGCQHVPNFKHIVINNGAHDSVGGQPTAGFAIDIPSIARACGYTHAATAETREQLLAQLNILRASRGPALLEVRVNKGARPNLGRPTTTPIQNRESFLTFLESRDARVGLQRSQ